MNEVFLITMAIIGIASLFVWLGVGVCIAVDSVRKLVEKHNGSKNN